MHFLIFISIIFFPRNYPTSQNVEERRAKQEEMHIRGERMGAHNNRLSRHINQRNGSKLVFKWLAEKKSTNFQFFHRFFLIFWVSEMIN